MKTKIISEQKLMRWLEISIDRLNELRRSQGFPYIAVGRFDRVYNENSVIDWLLARETNNGSVVLPETFPKASETYPNDTPTTPES